MHFTGCRHSFRLSVAAFSSRALAVMFVVGVRLAIAQDAPRLPMHERQERAAKLVQEALRMRAAGVATGTRELLAQAVSTAPEFAPAHWQLGEVQIDRRWMALAECQKTFASNRD